LSQGESELKQERVQEE
jgi:hypothetical protein